MPIAQAANATFLRRRLDSVVGGHRVANGLCRAGADGRRPAEMAMNELRIERDGNDLLVHIDVPVREAQAVHEAVKACRRTGVWSCPSGECVRIDRCDVQQLGDAVVLRLTPPAGETLSAAGISECMSYVIRKPTARAAR